MSDIRTDSYQEMKALLNERLDSIYREDEEQQKSGMGTAAKIGAGVAAAGAAGLAIANRKRIGRTLKRANIGARRQMRTAKAGANKFGNRVKRMTKMGSAKRTKLYNRFSRMQKFRKSGAKLQGPRTAAGNFF